MRRVKYLGNRKGFIEFATKLIERFNAKKDDGKFKYVHLFVVGTIKGVDIFEFIFARGKEFEHNRHVGVRIGVYDKKILTSPISVGEWRQLKKTAFESVAKHPELRIGQAFFNELYKYLPELAETVRGTEADPFHVDDYTHPKMNLFYDAIVERDKEESKDIKYEKVDGLVTSALSVADLNHYVINAAMNIMALTNNDPKVQEECGVIIDTVRKYTKGLK